MKEIDIIAAKLWSKVYSRSIKRSAKYSGTFEEDITLAKRLADRALIDFKVRPVSLI